MHQVQMANCKIGGETGIDSVLPQSHYFKGFLEKRMLHQSGGSMLHLSTDVNPQCFVRYFRGAICTCKGRGQPPVVGLDLLCALRTHPGKKQW